MHSSGKSQNQVARTIGIDPATLSRWVNGQPMEQVAAVSKIEQALELPRGHLFIAAGYVDGEPLSVRDAIATDPDLPANLRQIVLTTYDSVIQSALAARS